MRSKGNKENKRLDSKKVRAAEKQSIDGGHIRSVHTGGWAGKDDRQPPILDNAKVGGGKRKKKKEIEYCPAREGKLRHEYLYDEVWGPLEYSWMNDPEWEALRRFKICVHCNKEVVIRVNWRSRYRRIKK